MSTLLQDIRYAVRMLLKRPGFTVVAVFALALGIGANTAIFSVVNGVMLRPLPYQDPDRLMIIDETNPRQGFDRNEVSYPNFVAWRAQQTVFEEMAATRYAGMTLTGVENPAQLLGVFMTPNLFRLLGVTPALGRSFLPEENRPGGDPVAVVSHAFWQQRFGGDPDIPGETLTLNGQIYTIIGVMPAGFQYPGPDVEIWGALERLSDEFFMQNRAVHILDVIGRLKPGIPIEQARTEMETIMARIDRQYPGEDPGHRTMIASLHELMIGKVRPALLVLLGAVAFMLLIACANVANLLLARAAVRQKEMAIRAALGAGRGRTIRQLLTESLLLALVGGVISLLVAIWSVDLLVAQIEGFAPRANEIGIDIRVLGFTLGISVLTGLIFGLIPAFQSSKPDLNDALKDRRSAGEPGRGHVRQGLVVAEVALSLALLIGAGLMLKSFWRVLQENPGFRTDNLLLMTVSLPNTEYPDTEQVVAYYRQLPGRLEALPGVRTVSAVNALPISGGDSSGNLTIEGRPFPPGEEPGASFRRVLPNYFQSIGIPLLRGRAFDDRDMGGDRNVVIINETMARRHWPDEGPIGQRIKIGPPENEPWLTVVGVVGDVRNVGLDREPALATYEPHAQRTWRTMNLVIRTEVAPASVAETVRREIRARDPGILVYGITTMDQRIAASVAPRRLNMTLLGLFAGVALVLAMIGIYGVMAYTVTQRTREIGVRMALGAHTRDVMKLVVGGGMRMALAGIIAGLAVAYGLTRLMSGLLYEVSATDPVTFAGITALLVIVAVLACYIPARRASKVDPMTALRYE